MYANGGTYANGASVSMSSSPAAAMNPFGGEQILPSLYIRLLTVIEIGVSN